VPLPGTQRVATGPFGSNCGNDWIRTLASAFRTSMPFTSQFVP
jgi:hypothetical protein